MGQRSFSPRSSIIRFRVARYSITTPAVIVENVPTVSGFTSDGSAARAWESGTRGGTGPTTEREGPPEGGPSTWTPVRLRGRPLAFDDLLEDRTEVEHRLAEVLRGFGALELAEHRAAVPVALDDVGMVDREMRGPILRIAVRRIAALLERAEDDALGGARRVLGIVDETCLDGVPFVQIALARRFRKGPDVELLVLALD